MKTTALMPALGALLLVGGCSGEGASGPGEEASKRSPRSSEASLVLEPVPAAYRFILRSTCGERPLLGDFDIEVRDGRVVAARNLNPSSGYEPRPPFEVVPTLVELQQRAAEADEEAVIEYRTGRYGLPSRLELDPDPHGFDEEECYTIRNLEPSIE